MFHACQARWPAAQDVQKRPGRIDAEMLEQDVGNHLGEELHEGQAHGAGQGGRE